MDKGHFEIERKFLIRYPARSVLRSARGSWITQTYLLSPQKGVSERVRKRTGPEGTVYTHTVKTHISDLRRLELEDEISREMYEQLLQRADPARRVIEKERWCLDYRGQMFEIDLFPFWTDRALMELELAEEGQQIEFPEQIVLLKEVTHDKRYTNSSLAREVPMDEL